jgi:hypothetical protein
MQSMQKIVLRSRVFPIVLLDAMIPSAKMGNLFAATVIIPVPVRY